jgi:hypothetical protein
VDLQQVWWHDLNRMWWDCEDARQAGRREELTVAQKAVERGLIEARNGRLLAGQYEAAKAAVVAAMEGTYAE